MAPQSILKSTRSRAIKATTPSCCCSREMAREKVQLRFFLRQLIHTVGTDALTDMFKGFRIPVPTISNLYEAELHTYLVSNDNTGSMPKDAGGKPKRTVVPTELVIVKDEVDEDEKKPLKKVKVEPEERIFIDLTLDD